MGQGRVRQPMGRKDTVVFSYPGRTFVSHLQCAVVLSPNWVFKLGYFLQQVFLPEKLLDSPSRSPRGRDIPESEMSVSIKAGRNNHANYDLLLCFNTSWKCKGEPASTQPAKQAEKESVPFLSADCLISCSVALCWTETILLFNSYLKTLWLLWSKFILLIF